MVKDKETDQEYRHESVCAYQQKLPKPKRYNICLTQAISSLSNLGHSPAAGKFRIRRVWFRENNKVPFFSLKVSLLPKILSNPPSHQPTHPPTHPPTSIYWSTSTAEDQVVWIYTGG